MLNLQSPQWKLEENCDRYHWIFGYSILGQIQRSGPKTLMNFHDSPIEFEDFPGVWHRALGAKLRSFLCWCHSPPSRREVGNESSLQCFIDLNWRELILIDLNWSYRLSHILGLNWCEKAIVWLIDPSVDAAPQLKVGKTLLQSPRCVVRSRKIWGPWGTRFLLMRSYIIILCFFWHLVDLVESKKQHQEVLHQCSSSHFFSPCWPSLRPLMSWRTLRRKLTQGTERKGRTTGEWINVGCYKWKIMGKLLDVPEAVVLFVCFLWLRLAIWAIRRLYSWASKNWWLIILFPSFPYINQ